MMQTNGPMAGLPRGGPMAPEGYPPADDAVDLGELWLALRRGVRWIVGGALLGGVAAWAINEAIPEEYEATATVVLQDRADASSGFGLDAGGGGALSGLLNSSSGFDTELEILQSRAVIGSVVDSLQLQAWLVDPVRRPASALLRLVAVPPDVEEGAYAFRWEGDAYQIEGPSEQVVTAARGRPVEVGGVLLELPMDRALPASFTLELLDRQDAIGAVIEGLEADRAGGEVAELVYRAKDPVTAAAVPNAMVAEYVTRRTAVDKGLNRDRVRFLAEQVDSIYGELLASGENLRRFQEVSGTVDPTRMAEAQRAVQLRGELDDLQVEARALDRILSIDPQRRSAVADLAAYPTFLQNAAINDVLSRLLDMHTERAELLQRRTMEDPEVGVFTDNIAYLGEELEQLARSYRSGVLERQEQIRQELERYTDEVAGRQQVGFPLQQDYERLGETYVALQNQLVQARLAAMGEGSGVRQVDVAVPPKNAAFPIPILIIGLGVALGLILGLLAAVLRGYLGRFVADARQAGAIAGAPAVRLRRGTPLLLGALERPRTAVLVVPLGGAAGVAGQVARRVAATAAVKGEAVVLLDLEATRRELQATSLPAHVATSAGTALIGAPGPEGAERPRQMGGDGGYREISAEEAGLAADGLLHGRAVQDTVRRLEEEGTLVVAALPGLESAAAAALVDSTRSVLLAARTGTLTRLELREAAEALDRLGVRIAGVVLQDVSDGGAAGT